MEGILGRRRDLGDGYYLEFVSVLPEAEFEALAAQHFFQPFQVIRTDSLLTAGELAQQAALKGRLKGRVFLRLGAFFEGRLIGWSIGWQESERVYYMAMSLVVPEHRRRGIYTALVEGQVAVARELGFLEVQSRHVATNNAVLVAKLKMGFVIHGMEVDPQHGVLVKLIYNLNDVLSDMYNMRVGFKPLGPPLVRGGPDDKA